ncbi:MAG: hypothetical protein ACE5E6_01750 [Phycisphaerae bacterium]
MSDAAALSGVFTWIDWVVVAGYLAGTTVLGGVFAGRQATIRDFFLGGRKLPWYAVSGSIVATEISAVTFVGLPYVVFKDGGDFTYLQLGVFGALSARLVVGYVLVPAYYRREIYSPYDYIGYRLGRGARNVTTVVFAIGGMLAQSARVYLTAVVLELLLADSLFGWLAAETGVSTMTWSIWAIGLTAVVWTLMGGITTVIWTDVMLLLVFMVGAAVALGYVVASLDGGVSGLVAIGRAGGKFQFFDFDVNPCKAYTFWAAIIASTWHNVGAYGTDQMMAQRMFCCRSPRDARRAVVSSYVGIVVTIMVMLLGVGLYAYYKTHPLSGAGLALYEGRGDRILPIFILDVLPTGLKGLLIAAVFAAAISSLDSILVALSQATLPLVSAVRGRLGHGSSRAACSGGASSVDDASGAARAMSRVDDRRAVRVSRVLVVVWGCVLCVLSQVAERAADHYPSLLDLALSMAGYTGGALLAGVLLAMLPARRFGRGLCWSAPISVATVFAVAWHAPWARYACVGMAIVFLAAWVVAACRSRTAGVGRRTVWLVMAVAVMVGVGFFGYGVSAPDAVGHRAVITLAWPWYSPIGCTVAFVFGYVLAPRDDEGVVDDGGATRGDCGMG